VESEEYEKFLQFASPMGYEIIALSAKHGLGMEKLESHLADNVTVLCGPSGSGKSTLLNRLCGREAMKTGEISEKVGRGKHTTRHSELIETKGGYLVDTPGFSTLDISFIDKDQLQYYFPEFEPYLNKCRFTGCLHYKEPDCGVKTAVEEENIPRSRYEFYLKTLDEISSRRKDKW
jgi:ribosome biogenesis GTPase